MTKRMSILVALLLVATVFAACGGGGAEQSGTSPSSSSSTSSDAQRVEVNAANMKFSPADVTVSRGSAVQVVFTNNDAIAHDWVVQGIADAKTTRVNGGGTQTITFTPSQAGEYRIVCTEPGHEAAGMVGKLIVQ